MDTELPPGLHSVTHSSDYWALLYIFCQPDIVVDERVSRPYIGQHNNDATNADNVSMQALLEFGANPNVVDRNHDGLTALHWAASGDNRGCMMLVASLRFQGA
jgi:ankyrin repeat protein